MTNYFSSYLLLSPFSTSLRVGEGYAHKVETGSCHILSQLNPQALGALSASWRKKDDEEEDEQGKKSFFSPFGRQKKKFSAFPVLPV